ncbi:hypothetical protein [Streptomyces sp. NPDC046939]|uniref:hypothetical protein n=1 Tax=Streptomyces sp. NPDC046939 TaxID=3155376 RepID=UPI0033C94347
MRHFETPGYMQGSAMGLRVFPQNGQDEYRTYLDHLMNCAECDTLPGRCGVGQALHHAYRAARGDEQR